MFSTFLFFLRAGALVAAIVIPSEPLAGISENSGQLDSQAALTAYSLPVKGDLVRALSISTTRTGFTYGPDPAGTSIYYPSGALGTARTTSDVAQLEVDATAHLARVEADTALATATITAAGGLKSLKDYEMLYTGQWQTSIGNLTVPGMLQNYTFDSMFSMERLSSNPYSIRRLNPRKDTLPFPVNDTLVVKLTTTTLSGLFSAGRLFFVDYSYLTRYAATSGRYSAACSAYFYIDPTTRDFLPLAIKTNVGSNLTYTPLDTPNDWLLAKMMFNENDLWYQAWYHFASTHYVAGLSLTAATRCMSPNHPVLALLNRMNVQGYAFQEIAELLLFSPGTLIDQNFVFSGSDARKDTNDLYYQSAGAFQANYFHTQFAARGLINTTYGPALKYSPFVEDAEVIHASMQKFMTTFVNSYYTSPSTITGDAELQCWITEAVPAKILDFPSAPIKQRQTLIDMLTHIAFLVSVQHHTMNTNDPATLTGVLPFHPAALYAPIPTTKGVKDILPFLPSASQAIDQISLLAQFSRPEYQSTVKSLTNMFNDPTLLAGFNAASVAAAQVFQTEMTAFSGVVSSRRFDATGYNRGMPYLWRGLDPQVIPFYAAI
ncbi:hypothetical protein BP5796_13090 [Coleophoma crateriformis]|uniref:Manganese lipoxygenase n=1 Tax=Coleophoma crateriformis TaxID=565419 RepID=A0A3D8Q437_9HELO|nr:hypothetical protein BP5796_13090 [Coleophoma crateriformis]